MHSQFRPVRGYLLALAAGLAFSMPVAAEGPGWSSNSVVKKLIVTRDGGINVELSPALTGCVSNSGYGASFASIYPDHPGINRIKASLLAAYLSGGTVKLYFSDSTCKVAEVMLGGE
ncbi:hypothetical protein O0880_20875 [Janthinobacterium sp. SUN118]|uniref:hypothetical protein n=1 Tax=Janthinobacterium sp. SUN118 TaxID=3004100 RepID=UPI0025B1FEAC|nr:hypothetical protein [Janthinobacterium sp. SUN118]MDN2711882.1 hypothetical protein [Janthinobacterium sp. SUN118]